MMKYRKELTINDVIVTLQALDTFTLEIKQLQRLRDRSNLEDDELEELNIIISNMTLKNDRLINDTSKTMNGLNRFATYL